MGEADRVLLQQDPSRTVPPWEDAPGPLPGEEEPLTVAGAMVRWTAANRTEDIRFPAVAVAATADAAERWNSAPAPGEHPVLLAPEEAFPGLARAYAGAIRSAYKAGPVMDESPPGEGDGLVLVISAEPAGVVAGRLRTLARDPGMKGRPVLVWGMGSGLREDMAASLLAEGQLAAIGFIASPPVEWHRLATDLAALSDAFVNGPPARLDDLPVPALWFY